MKVEREKKNLLWKSVSSQIPSRTESHHLTASFWLSPSDHLLSATKKKKEDASTHCCFAYENPKSTPLPLYIVLSFFELHSDKCAEVKRLIKEEGAEESRASYYESIHSDDALREGHTLRWAPLR